MALKRRGAIQSYQWPGNYANKRIKLLERKMRLANTEIRNKTFSDTASLASNTIQTVCMNNVEINDSDSGRNGNRIKLLRYEVHVTCNAEIEVFVVQGQGTYVPGIGDFANVPGGHILTASNRKIYKWDHRWMMRDDVANAGAVSTRYTINRQFKKGICFDYDQPNSTSARDKNLYLAFLNRDTQDTATYQYSLKIWYVDY